MNQLTNTEYPNPETRTNDYDTSRLRRLGRNLLVLCATGVTATSLIGSGSAASHETIASQTTSYEASPEKLVTSVEIRDRVVIINGKPTFLFGVWAPKDDWAVRTLNVNTLIDHSGDVSQEQLARLVNGRAWVLVRSDPAAGPFAGSPLPNEIGVAMRDEPDLQEISPSELVRSPKDGRLTFENFTHHIGDIINQHRDPSVRSKNDYDLYISNLGKKPVVSFDYYPFNRDACNDFNASVGPMYHYTLGTKWVTTNNTPIGAYIETGPIDSDSCQAHISPEVVTGEAKAAITAGAGIINWWTYSWLNPDNKADPNTISPEVAATIRKFTAEVHHLSPVLLAKQMNEKKLGLASAWDGPIKLGGRIATDRNGKPVYYILALNATDKPVNMEDVENKLPALTGQQVFEVISGQELQAKNGKIDSIIEPYDWQIFRYAPKTKTPIRAGSVKH